MSTKVAKRKLDRLSNLPNPIIVHILSLMDTKFAVQTCVMSRKWWHHWTQIHSLNINFESFSKKVVFGKFVLHVLHRRRPCKLHRLSFRCGYSSKPPPYTKKIFQYAFSRGVKELDTDLADIPPFFYKSTTLETLKVQYGHYSGNSWDIKKINSFGFASLSTLELPSLKLKDKDNNHDIFSNHLNLKSLKLGECSIRASENFTLVSSSLVYLKICSLYHGSSNPKDRKVVISAPRLEVFDLNVSENVHLGIYKCPVLRMINLQIRPPIAWMIDWKQDYFSYWTSMTGGRWSGYCKLVKLSFKFSKGQFLSYNIAANTGITVTEMDEVEGKRSWFSDGEMVWQGISICQVN